MDPVTGLALATEVAKAIILAYKVFATLSRYCRVVRHAPGNSTNLRSKLDSLVDLLSHVQETFKRNPTQLYRSTFIVEISNLRHLLNKLDEQTQGIRRLRWRFQRTENLEIIEKIGHLKDSL